jgi:hypothetical protein
VYENRVPRRRFGPKTYEDEFHNFYASPSIIRVIKPKRVRCAENVACKGDEKYI